MVLIYRGFGAILLLLGFIAAHVLCNLDIYLHYRPEMFGAMNHWLPFLLAGLLAAVLSAWAVRTKRLPPGGVTVSLRDHIFWVPLPLWVPILLGLSWWAHTPVAPYR